MLGKYLAEPSYFRVVLTSSDGYPPSGATTVVHTRIFFAIFLFRPEIRQYSSYRVFPYRKLIVQSNLNNIVQRSQPWAQVLHRPSLIGQAVSCLGSPNPRSVSLISHSDQEMTSLGVRVRVRRAAITVTSTKCTLPPYARGFFWSRPRARPCRCGRLTKVHRLRAFPGKKDPGRKVAVTALGCSQRHHVLSPRSFPICLAWLGIAPVYKLEFLLEVLLLLLFSP